MPTGPKKQDRETVEELEGTTPTSELVEALDEPHGDLRFSGAAPGVKVETDDKLAEEARDVTAGKMLDVPKSTEDAQKRAAEVDDEVRDIQWDVRKEGLINLPGHTLETVYSTPDEKGNRESMTISAVDGKLSITATTTNRMSFDREDALAFQRAATHSSVVL